MVGITITGTPARSATIFAVFDGLASPHGHKNVNAPVRDGGGKPFAHLILGNIPRGNRSTGIPSATQSTGQRGRTFSWTEGDARISPCLPRSRMSEGSSTMAPEP
jgi:hypothetical protein